MTRRSHAKYSPKKALALRARLYSRVSSDEQVDGYSYSLDAQARAAAGYCEAQGWTLEHEYRE